MSTRRQRERMRLARIEFDKEIDAYRHEQAVAESLESMTKAELIQFADDNSIEINKAAKKAEIKSDVLEIVKKK